MANYRRIARAKARKYGINPRYFARQIGAESNFDPNAQSPAGAVGIAQIMPETARGWGVDPMKPVAALDAAAKNMAGYLKSYGGDWAKALAAYNAGTGAVQKYGGVPPFAETKAYIAKILGGGDPHDGFKGGEGMAGVAKNRVRTTSTTATDTDGALVDALMAGAAGRRKTGLLADASRRIDSGAYTTTTRTKETIPVGTGGSVRDAAVGSVGAQRAAGIIGKAEKADRLNLLGKLPYKWGGGHGSTPAALGELVDCSGFVSQLVLKDRTMVSGAFKAWGKAGKGKWSTVWANDDHVLISVKDPSSGKVRWFGTSASNKGGGAGEISAPSASYLAGFTPRHPGRSR